MPELCDDPQAAAGFVQQTLQTTDVAGSHNFFQTKAMKRIGSDLYRVNAVRTDWKSSRPLWPLSCALDSVCSEGQEDAFWRLMAATRLRF